MLHHRAGRLREAEAEYRRVLALQPNHPDALNLLGVIAQQSGRTDEAIRLLGSAVLAQPGNAVFYSNLAQVLVETGDYKTAAELSSRAVALKPDYACAHNNLGNALRGLGRQDDAAHHYRQAMTCDPAFAEPCNNLGVVLQAREQLDEAVALYRAALQHNPRLYQAHSNLGSALRECGELDEALVCYRHALELKPDFADAHAGLAALHIDLGQFDAAHAAIDRALACRPNHPAAWACIPGTRRMTAADQNWLDIAQQLLAGGKLLPMESFKLQYAIGKFYDDTQQYDRAFAAYRTANAGKRAAEGAFDRAGFSRLIDTLICIYTPEFVNRSWAGTSTSQRPVLIVGMPRSGTSLTEQIIASHPRAFGAGELPYWSRQVRAHKAAILGGQLDESMLAALATGYEAGLRTHAPDAARVVDKMPNNFQWLGLFHITFPQAKIIHTRRHPIDTCLSIYFQNFKATHLYATDLDDLVFYYREYERLMAYWRSVLPKDCFLEIDYEDLIENQEEGSRKIIEFLDLPWDEHCLDFHKTERKVGTASNWQVRQKLYKTSKERWRNYESHIGPLASLLAVETSCSAQTATRSPVPETVRG
jgi:tetratricopeptide (TPR) repeat protein